MHGTEGGAVGGMEILKEGYLTKQGHVRKNWKRRWFVLTKSQMSYHMEPGAPAKGRIPLDNVTISLDTDALGKENCFGLFHGERKPYFMCAETPAEVVQWVKAIRDDFRVGLLDFDMLSLLGKGNFGKVMKVKHKESGAIHAMKILRKDQLTKKNDIEHTRTERRLLQKIKHPFVVGLHYAFQTDERLYLVMDYVSGGDLYYHLKNQRRFPEETVRIWAAQMVLAIGYLHTLSIVYRDLKPENVLLDSQGNLHLTDFGLSKIMEDPTKPLNTFCGTPYYLAPEMLVSKKGYDNNVDWWSCGIIIFEMIVGQPPFFSDKMQQVYEKIVAEKHQWPEGCAASESCRSIVNRLLERDPRMRLGAQGGYKQIEADPFFGGLDWQAVLKKSISAGFTPKQGVTGTAGQPVTPQSDSRAMGGASPREHRAQAAGAAGGSHQPRAMAADSDRLFDGFSSDGSAARHPPQRGSRYAVPAGSSPANGGGAGTGMGDPQRRSRHAIPGGAGTSPMGRSPPPGGGLNMTPAASAPHPHGGAGGAGVGAGAGGGYSQQQSLHMQRQRQQQLGGY